MDIQLGTLQIISAAEHPELMTKSVADLFAVLPGTDKIGVAEIDANLSDTAAFCEHYQVGLDKAANCVVLEAKRADKSWFAACVVLGNTRADVNGLARRTLDARRVSFAPMDQAVAQTGMEYGAITPIGLPSNWAILVDKAVSDSDYVIIGSGIRKSKLVVPGSFFASLSNAQILEGLGQVKQLD
ncbi:MAG: YbaK/EbsC family protein [Candidatus Liptonbacteria bacterium]|nr:YbaK/EbsC family protein [Candidatus Liptonbacteria bacterium]